MPVLKHHDDDGDLSIVAEAGQLLIACNKGHYWIVEAEVHTISGRQDAGIGQSMVGDAADGISAVGDALGEDDSSNSGTVDVLSAFGSAGRRALGME